MWVIKFFNANGDLRTQEVPGTSAEDALRIFSANFVYNKILSVQEKCVADVENDLLLRTAAIANLDAAVRSLDLAASLLAEANMGSESDSAIKVLIGHLRNNVTDLRHVRFIEKQNLMTKR